MEKNIELTPKEKYERLKESIINQIDSIDYETPWSSMEPEWWLEMMELQKYLINLKYTKT